MRPSWLIVSVSLHTAAVGAAVTAGLWATQAAARRPAQVEIRPSEATPPPAAVQTPPDVVREAATVTVEAQLREPAVVEPIRAPETASVVPQPLPELRAVWPLAPIRRATPPSSVGPATAASDVDAPVAPPTVLTPARPSAPTMTQPAAEVRARPRQDNPPPSYPADERAKGHEGEVLVRAFVDEFGVVQSVELAEASPFAGLNREALRAVRGWRFVPASRGGALVAGVAEVLVEYRLTPR